MLQYRGGKIFGKSANDPSKLAEAMLGLMINYLHGGPKFLLNLIPVAKLNTNFLCEQLKQAKNNIHGGSGKLKVIISDGNRINQSLFNKMKTVHRKAWLSSDRFYLLYDYAHLIKNIRNLWLTEKTGELLFRHEDKEFVASWHHLRDLHRSEALSMLKMSKLSEVAVNPRPIERQRVNTCLQVFCEETATALDLYGKWFCKDVSGTLKFIRIVVKWWTIMNVKNKRIDERNCQPLQAVVSPPDDRRLDFIRDFGDM